MGPQILSDPSLEQLVPVAQGGSFGYAVKPSIFRQPKVRIYSHHTSSMLLITSAMWLPAPHSSATTGFATALSVFSQSCQCISVCRNVVTCGWCARSCFHIHTCGSHMVRSSRSTDCCNGYTLTRTPDRRTVHLCGVYPSAALWWSRLHMWRCG